MTGRRVLAFLTLFLVPSAAVLADPPTALNIFPAGGQRGTKVDVRVGAYDLNRKTAFEILGAGVSASKEIQRTETTWLEGPILQSPESVEIEDYPKDHAGQITIDANAQIGPRAWRIWNSEGASGSLPFIVGDHREVVETEREEAGNPLVVHVSLPVTANGRIFPREDVDLWQFTAKAGELVSARADVGRINSKLDPWLEAIGPNGKPIADVTRGGTGNPTLDFVAPANGTYTIKVLDLGNMGSQLHIYRLTLTKGPRIDWIYPLGGQRGSLVSFLVGGPGLSPRSQVIKLSELASALLPERATIQLPDLGPATVEVDDFPEVLESEPNDTLGSTMSLRVPGIANGLISKAGDVDVWRVVLRAWCLYRIDLRASQLGSNLDPILTVTDRTGKLLGATEDNSDAGTDPELTVSPSKTAVYYVRIRDRFRSRGGPGWGYRLRVRYEPEPDFALDLDSDTVTLLRDGSAKLKVHAKRSGGFTGPIELAIDGLPEGISASKATIEPKSKSAEFTLKAHKKAPIRSVRIVVRGTANVHSGTISRVAVRRGTDRLPDIDTVRLAVGIKPPFVLTGPIDFSASPRGTVHHHPFQLKSEGCIGPIEVRIADRQIRHLQGVTAPLVVIPPGAEDFDFPITLPPWMETGRTSRTVITTTGIVREPDGREHEVNRSWPDNVHQLVTVVGPGLLSLQAGPAMITLGPKRVVDIPVKLVRGKGIKGPARVTLVIPWSIRGLSAEPLTFAPDQVAGTMRLQCDPTFEAPPSSQIHLDATSAGPVANDPVTARASLTILSESKPDPTATADSTRELAPDAHR